MTLVEAVAGIVLLSTLMVAVVTAHARLKAQSARAARQLEACRVLDGLMERWWGDPSSLPRSGVGDVPDRRGWQWRTRTLDRFDAETVGGQVVRVEVFSPQDRAVSAASIEILLPMEAPVDAAP